jgi:hypothetical protein
MLRAGVYHEMVLEVLSVDDPTKRLSDNYLGMALMHEAAVGDWAAEKTLGCDERSWGWPNYPWHFRHANHDVTYYLDRAEYVRHHVTGQAVDCYHADYWGTGREHVAGLSRRGLAAEGHSAAFPPMRTG